MKITDLLRKDIMIFDLQATEKEAAIDEMITSLHKSGILTDVAEFKDAILKREEQSSTGLGDGIAMPHAKNKSVKEPTVLFAKSNKGVDYDSLDGQPAYLFFMIAVPEGGNNTHLETLAALSRKLIDGDFVNQLKDADTPEQVLSLFSEEQEEAQETTLNEQNDQKKPFVVAITACPTGIAHTYMAEDALKKKAKEMNVDIRVETQGSEGAKNRLTDEEIKRADAVIIAAGKKVDLNRFNGKHVIQRPVADGIKKSEELISLAIHQDAPIYNEGGSEIKADDMEDKSNSIWGRIYKDLMNGISHMLPFVVGGGILLAISFLLESVLGKDSTAFTFLNEIGGNAFSFLIPIFAGFIALSIADRPGLMPGMVGGLIAVNSNAGFLGGLVAGFLAGYVVILLKRVFRGLPKTLEGLKPILIYPVLSLFLTGLLMYFVFGPIFATINNAMVNFLEGLGTGNATILGLLLGGMMAIDMGGPFNKAAYAFSIGIFTDTGDGSLMAAVMAGGMVPPLAIALASTFFKNKFSAEERKSGVTNYVMGLSFITEGAIPFAAADPLRIIGSSIVGSAIAGGLTQFFNTAIPAPHGGIFVVPLAENPLLFLLSLVIGAIIAAVLLGLWRKPVEE
ncbi:PTS fructose transporter subunit IIABC [Ornithinibacillus bavariensis]|uniref:PTS fructose transporter subunit IIC n=1 Tax=Ornithinibacillus bavariensis TaxID=545502 RepID=A0A919X4L5_9BACI|nr:fructose-specific PTS transporter subunit EIIC [Ornithinibacillus bavariensis]GIO25411.1 PTS fructose transporter subunit IIC [Ornithinibacillus bavariensis]HAM80515.1 PTS fructose transporter subunit IIC [Ornithinibacillus sp.]